MRFDFDGFLGASTTCQPATDSASGFRSSKTRQKVTRAPGEGVRTNFVK